MQVTETVSEGLKRAYTVVVPAGDIEKRRGARFAELSRNVRMPGFRPGKVPLALLRQRYGSAVTAEVLEESVNEATQQMLSDRGLRPAQKPKVDVVNLETVARETAADLEFKVELEVLPEIAMPAFKDIQITRLKAEVPGTVLDQLVQDIAKRRRTLVDITEERGAAAGDVLVLDYEGSVDGVPFEGGKAENAEIDLGGEGFIPGFTEGMIGMRPGEERVIDVTFPADYGAADLAGKAAQFKLLAHKLQRGSLPEINDAFAQSFGFDSLEDLRDLFRRQRQRELDQLARLRVKRALLDVLAKMAEFAAPEGLVEAEFGQIWARLEQERKAGRLEADDLAKDEETLRADYRAIADRRVRLGLLLAEIARQKGITVGQDELLGAARAEASKYKGQEQQVMALFRDNPDAIETLRGPILEEKVVDYVLELAQVEEKLVTPEELAEMPEETASA
jgi:trigger factor